MRKLLTILFLSLCCTLLGAQETATAVSGQESAGDEIAIDSTLVGLNVFDLVPGGVRQSATVDSAVRSRIAANRTKMVNGFRIRLYFNSAKNAREESAALMRRFNALYPRIPVYRSYSTPNFKVTAGSFRTRAEAEYLLARLKTDFPDAFIVRERFRFPSMGTPDTSPLPVNPDNSQ